MSCRSGCQCWQADAEIITEWRVGFQRHVAGTLDGPFVILLQQHSADESDDGRFVGEDLNDVAAAFDLVVQPLDGVDGVYLCSVLGGKSHVGQHVCSSLVHQGGKLWYTRPRLIGDIAPLFARGSRIVLGKRGADPGRDDAALGLARIGHGIRHKMHDPNAIDVLRVTASLPFEGAGPARSRQRRDARFPRG